MAIGLKICIIGTKATIKAECIKMLNIIASLMSKARFLACHQCLPPETSTNTTLFELIKPRVLKTSNVTGWISQRLGLSSMSSLSHSSSHQLGIILTKLCHAPSLSFYLYVVIFISILVLAPTHSEYAL